jgi:hypothetical protein
MLISAFHQRLITIDQKLSRPAVRFWLGLSLTFSVLFALMAMQQAFSRAYVVQDDARQHVFWMQRFQDPTLFPGDLIANYFQSVAPIGYTTVYRSLAALGIDPLVLNKLLPMGLGLLTTGYCFGLALEILPVPLVGFVSSLLLNQHLWLKDDLVSATPRAFLYPLFLAFLYYLLRRSLLPCLGAIALTGLFYPQYVFVESGVLLLRWVRWQGGKLQLSAERQDARFCFLGLAIAFLVLLPFALGTSEFGPTITAHEAKQLPEFLRRGRSSFFVDDPLDYWILGRRSGLLSKSLFTPATLGLGLSLPWLLKGARYFPLVEQIRNRAILLQILLSAIGLFLAAHALLFRLHLPSRYTGHSLNILISLSTGIALTVLIDGLLRWATGYAQAQWRSRIALSLIGAVGAVLILYPGFVPQFPLTAYQVGRFPALYQFFVQQPKNIRIASLADEAGNLPTFARRSVLVANEYAIPYHVGYYRQFRQRVLDLIQAQYTPSLSLLKQEITQHKIDFWLLDPTQLSAEALAKSRWLRQFQPVTDQALARLQAGQMPALQRAIVPCTVFQAEPLRVLSADCILKLSEQFSHLPDAVTETKFSGS